MINSSIKYYIWYLFAYRLLGWKVCIECGHRGYSHYWHNSYGHYIDDGKVYCGKWQCGCGYHCGR